MKLIVSLLVFIFAFFPYLVFAQGAPAPEGITITTYYPSPYGSYKELRAHQMSIGSAYQSSNLSDGNLLVSGSVGIGTTAPAERLDLGGGNIAMGYEIRTNDCNIGIGNSQHVCGVTCPPGKYVLGGGCFIVDTPGDTAGTLQNSHAGGNNDWWCAYSGITQPPGVMRVQAICANIR